MSEMKITEETLYRCCACEEVRTPEGVKTRRPPQRPVKARRLQQPNSGVERNMGVSQN